VVEAVGGGGQSRTGLHHQTHGTRKPGRAVHGEPREQLLQPHPHPEPRTEARCACRKTPTQRLSPVVRAQRRGPGLAWGGEDTGRVRHRRQQRLRVTGLRVGGLWEAEGVVGGAGRGERRSWIRLDGEDLGGGTTGTCGAAGVQDKEAGPVLL